MGQIEHLRWAGGLGLLAAICAGGCAAPRLSERDQARIRDMLEAQDRAWNEGDVEGFMAPYWHSPDLTFSSDGKVTRGWQDTLNRYKTRYPTRANMGRLAFSDLEMIPIAPRAALVLGRWRLDREKPVGGSFSLVLRKEAGQWVIIHDHTSTDSP